VNSAWAGRALYACLGLGVTDLAALNLLVLPTIEEEAVAIAASPPLVPTRIEDEEPLPSASRLASVPAPTIVQLEPLATVEFDVGSRRVSRRALRRLECVLPRLRDALEVTVVGHADPTGPMQLNERLSEERARAVATRLSALGVVDAHVRIEARGAREPSEDGVDRRVEIYLGEHL
jgi:outer membrane protein OmpA-like peptidoglycan-associated protein